jgi:hypothetical protein
MSISSLIIRTLRLNRIIDVCVLKFDLSVVIHSKARLFKGQEKGRDKSI